MIGSMRIESVYGPVSDQEQAKEFYVDALGYELLVDGVWREGVSSLGPQTRILVSRI